MLEAALNRACETMEGNSLAEEYDARHGIESAQVLTVYTDEHAGLVADFVRERIEGKTVVEVGGGIGLLALHLSQYAKHVYVIEANPVWTSVFVMFLMARKPKNVTFIFGAAEEVVGQIKADVALFCTHSAARVMEKVAGMFAPQVIDIYGEVVPQLENGDEWNRMRDMSTTKGPSC